MYTLYMYVCILIYINLNEKFEIIQGALALRILSVAKDVCNAYTNQIRL